jgi:hypothetical protein
MRRTVALLVVLVLATSNLVTVESVSAQSVPVPAVPQFTLEPVGSFFDIPPTYTFNASTGMFDSNDGYHVQYSSVKIVIKNQPFSDQSNGDKLYYNVRIRPRDYPDSYWLELFSAGNEGFPIQSLSNYTIIPLSVEGAQVLGVTIPTGATTDIQVEAMIGHIGRNNTLIPYPYPYVFFGETSGWSNTQTITLPANVPLSSASPSPSPTPTPAPAQTPRLTKNFSGTMDSYFFHGGIYVYTYNVSMSVETESNGEWVVDNSYQINWRISIVNFSPDAIQEPNNLSLTFYNPIVGISGNLRNVISQTSVTIGHDGLLKVEFTPDKSVNQADVRTTLMVNENYSSQEKFTNGYWNQNFDIWINIVDSLSTLPPATASPVPSPTIPEFPTWIILPLAIISALLIVLASKKGNSRKLLAVG